MKIITMRTGALAVNTYLAELTPGRGFVVDPGGDAELILKRASEHGIRPEAQLLTHAHFDHIGACRELQERGIPVIVHEGDADKLRGTDENLSGWMNVPTRTAEPDVILRGTEGTLSLAGAEIRWISTPGHSSGSVCYLADGVLFSGDTLFAQSVGRTDFPDGSAAVLLRSLKKLFAMEGDFRVLPGHEEETTLEEERRWNPYAGAAR